MSREILDAMTVLGREKGIAPEKLRLALEDALLSAYKKQPDSAKYARVELDPETADFRVIELIIPERLEAHLIVETIDEGTTYDPETGEMVEPTDPEIDPAKFEEYKDQIEERDVTPGDFGRIAAQTAKQVILQRIREAERDMMFEEYRDRVGELITGIVQQSDSRYTLVQIRERVEALLPKSEQVDGERYDHSQRVKAVIKEVSPSTKGPSIIVSRRDPGAHQEALRARGARDRRRPRRDRQRRPRARLPLEDRGHLARRRRRSGRRLRRPARLARADGRLRAARREDRHHPLQRRARPLRRQGPVTRPRARGARRRRRQAGDGHRARRPALAGDRPRGPERAPRRPPDRLADRHQVRDRVRRRGAGVRATRRRRRRVAAPPSCRRAGAVPTRRCPARATAAWTPIRRSPTRPATRCPRPAADECGRVPSRCPPRTPSTSRWSRRRSPAVAQPPRRRNGAASAAVQPRQGRPACASSSSTGASSPTPDSAVRGAARTPAIRACAERALARGGFARSFRRAVHVDPDLLHSD